MAPIRKFVFALLTANYLFSKLLKPPSSGVRLHRSPSPVGAPHTLVESDELDALPDRTRHAGGRCRWALAGGDTVITRGSVIARGSARKTNQQPISSISSSHPTHESFVAARRSREFRPGQRPDCHRLHEIPMTDTDTVTNPDSTDTTTDTDAPLPIEPAAPPEDIHRDAQTILAVVAMTGFGTIRGQHLIPDRSRDRTRRRRFRRR